MKRVLVFLVLLTACGGGGHKRSGIGKVCGGLVGFQCTGDLYCDFPKGTCGAADETGTCQIKPEVCTEIFAPVCGCDGVTYANECFARGAGEPIVIDGECPGTPQA